MLVLLHSSGRRHSELDGVSCISLEMRITQSVSVLTIGKTYCFCTNQTLCFVLRIILLACWGNQGTLEFHCSRNLVTGQQDSWESKWRFEFLEYLLMCNMKSIISYKFFHSTSLLNMYSTQCLEEVEGCGQYSVEKLVQNKYWKYVIFTLVFYFHSYCLISLLLLRAQRKIGSFR